MHRFFVPPKILETEPILLPAEVGRQVTRVLRLRPGDRIILLDGSGVEFEVELLRVSVDTVQGKLIAQRAAISEPPVKLTLFLCLTQREKFEWMLQKCTEAGAGVFIPVYSNRSLVQAKHSVANKITRWQSIVQEAAEQCGRGIIPMVLDALEYQDAVLLGSTTQQRCLLAWEEEQSITLNQRLRGLQAGSNLGVLIGPEGGLTPEEVHLAVANGWQTFSLGPRTFRMETAALAATVRITAAFEDHGDL